MPDYESLTDDELVAEVVTRMPRRDYRPCGTKLAEYHVGRGEWILWLPHRSVNHLEHVKREIERRGWEWHSGYTTNGYLAHIYLGNPIRKGLGTAIEQKTEPRAWLLAFLRATDAEKEASGE